MQGWPFPPHPPQPDGLSLVLSPDLALGCKHHLWPLIVGKAKCIMYHKMRFLILSGRSEQLCFVTAASVPTLEWSPALGASHWEQENPEWEHWSSMGSMILFSAVVFTTLSSNFCLARAALDPNPSSDWQELSVQRTGHKMKECSTNRNGRLSSGLFPPQSQAEGSVLSSQSWETSKAEPGEQTTSWGEENLSWINHNRASFLSLL